MVTKRIFLKSSDEALYLMGQQDQNLRCLEQEYGTQIFVRQGGHAGDFSLVVRGPSGKVDKTLGELEGLRDNYVSGRVKTEIPAAKRAETSSPSRPTVSRVAPPEATITSVEATGSPSSGITTKV